jgi:hypothetical protein
MARLQAEAASEAALCQDVGRKQAIGDAVFCNEIRTGTYLSNDFGSSPRLFGAGLTLRWFENHPGLTSVWLPLRQYGSPVSTAAGAIRTLPSRAILIGAGRLAISRRGVCRVREATILTSEPS